MLTKTSKASRERLSSVLDIQSLSALQRDMILFARGLGELLAKDVPAADARQRLLQVVGV